MERDERVREALEAIDTGLKMLLQRWMPILEGQGFFNELGEGHLKSLAHVRPCTLFDSTAIKLFDVIYGTAGGS